MNYLRILLVFMFTLTMPGTLQAKEDNFMQRAFSEAQEKLEKLIDRFKPVELIQVDAKTTRGDETKNDTECIPSMEYKFPNWPKTGTTLLTGELMIREEQTGLPCSQVTYVVQEASTGKTIKSFAGRAGALIQISFDGIPGKHYQWFAKTEEITGPKSEFAILSQQQAEQITTEMRRFAAHSPNLDYRLVQALYLQELSDTSQVFDLYEESIMLLKNYRDDSFSLRRYYLRDVLSRAFT